MIAPTDRARALQRPARAPWRRFEAGAPGLGRLCGGLDPSGIESKGRSDLPPAPRGAALDLPACCRLPPRAPHRGMLGPVPGHGASALGQGSSIRSRTGLGLGLMFASVVAFALMQACVKDLREHGMSTLEVMVWRSAPGLPLVWLELALRGVSLRPRRPRVVALRTGLGCLAMGTNFWAVHSLALVQHAVVHLTQPVFVAVASPRLLGERASPAAVAALLVAITGAILVLLPSGAAVGAVAAVTMPLLPGLVGIASAIFSALAHVTLRMATAPHIETSLDHGAPADAPSTVVFHFTATVTVLGLVVGACLGDFRELPQGLDLGDTALRVAAMATMGLLGQLAMSSAYARAEAPSVAIVGYAAIPISAGIDAWIWQASLGWSTLVGASVMLAAGWLLMRASRGTA
jgi:drug/metabolite transporter (DMT)-like permease